MIFCKNDSTRKSYIGLVNGILDLSQWDILESIDILSKDHSIAERMISHEIPFENAEEAFKIAGNADASLKVMIVELK